ncbi:MAG: hypothetical protein SNJ71_01495 [Bacteroidales bacterium]
MKITVLKQILFVCIFYILVSCSHGDAVSPDSSSTGVGGSMARLTINGNTLIAATTNSELKAFTIGNNGVPVQSSVVAVNATVETIFPYNNYVLLGTETGMFAYEVSDNGKLTYISNVEHIRSCDPVAAQNNFAYITLNGLGTRCGSSSSMLQIYDISSITKPKLIKEYAMDNPFGVGIDGNLLFVCDNGLAVYDVQDKSNIQKLMHHYIAAWDVIPYKNILIVTGETGIHQYSYNLNDKSLELLSSIKTN